MKLLSSAFLLVVIFFTFLTNSASGQQWTAEQQDVWKGVEAYWAVGMSDNPADFLNYFDDSYTGWYNEDPAPSTKADAQKQINYWAKKGKVAYYSIVPARIWVNGNFAFVHYYYTEVNEDKDGKPMTERGRWTDILMKKDGKWLMVGDHGGPLK
jgi:ketosteroid isomerase-like protein